MNKSKIITAILVAGGCLQSVMATEVVKPEVDEVMHVDGELCLDTPLCPPPLQQLEPAQNEDDSG